MAWVDGGADPCSDCGPWMKNTRHAGDPWRCGSVTRAVAALEKGSRIKTTRTVPDAGCSDGTPPHDSVPNDVVESPPVSAGVFGMETESFGDKMMQRSLARMTSDRRRGGSNFSGRADRRAQGQQMWLPRVLAQAAAAPPPARCGAAPYRTLAVETLRCIFPPR